MSTHRIIETRSNVHRDSFSTICSCGWESISQPTLARALTEGDDHILAMTRAQFVDEVIERGTARSIMERKEES